MRDITNDVEKTETLVRLSVYDGSDWISFGNESDYERLYSISLNNSIDQSGWNLEARFRNHPDLESLDPYYDGTFKGLLAKYNKCRFEISKDQGSNWYTMFEGYSSETSPERKVDKEDTVIYRPIDPSKRLKDRIIPWDLTNWDSTLSFQNIDAFDAVDEILSAAGFSETINRDISDNPQKTIYGQKPYEPRGMTVWSAIQKIFEETGYNVLYRIDDSTGNLDLAVIDPSHDLAVSGRADSSDWDETWIKNNFRVFNGNFDRRELTVDDKDVRTKVKVYYQGENGQDSVVVAADDSSYAIPTDGDNLHREQIMNEPDNALIDSEAEARRLAQYTRDDLREPSPDVGFDFPFFYPSAQLTDVYRMGGTGDYTVDFFVTGIDHTIDVDRKIGTTSLSGAADRVIGKRDYWLNKDLDDDEDIRQRGDGRPPKSPKNPPRLDKSISQVESSGETRASVVAIGELAPEFDIIYYKWQYRIYNGNNWLGWENAGTSDKDHPQSTISSLAVGSDRKLQVRYAPIDRQSRESGGTAPWSPAQEILLNGDATPPGLPTSISTTGGPGRVELTWNLPTIDGNGAPNPDDFDHTNIYWDTTTPNPSSDSTKKVETSGDDWTFNTTDTLEYHFRLSSVDNTGNESDLTDEVTASAKRVGSGDGYKPAVPNNLSLDNRVTLQDDGTVVGKIKADWNNVTTNANGDSTDDILGYEVWLHTSNTDPSSTGDIIADTESSEELLSGLDVGETYYVRVRCYDYEDKYSDWSGSVSKTISSDDTVPNSPTLDKVRGHPESIYVKWTKPDSNTDGSTITDFSHCLVYHSASSGIDINDGFTYDGPQKIDGEHWIHQDLETEITRYYKITAVDNTGNESTASFEKSATPNVTVGDHTSPDPPNNPSVSSNTVDHQEDGTVYTIIQLDWDDNTESDLKGYEIALTESSSPTDPNTDFSNWSVNSSVESSSGIVKPLKPNTDYGFSIRASDTEQNKSAWLTPVVTVKTEKDDTAPSSPTSVSASSKIGSVEFSWDAVSVADFAYYKVYIYDNSGPTLLNTFNSSSTTFTWYGTSTDTVYVTISAVDRSGNESTNNNSSSAKSPSSIVEDDVSWNVFDIDNDTLDDIQNGSLYGRIKKASLNNNGLVLIDAIIEHEDNDSQNHGLIKATDITAGHIKLVETKMPNGESTGVQLDSDGYIIVKNQSGSTAISGGKIQTGSITATEIDSNTITATEISADAMTLGEMNFSSDDRFLDQSVLKIGGQVDFVPGYDASDFRTVIRQSSPPPTERPSGDPLQEGDIWIDTDTNVQHTYNANSSSFVQNKVGSGNIIIRQNSKPTERPSGDSLENGDMWIDTSTNVGNKPYTYNGSNFIESYTIINGGNIETGTITASEINAENQLIIGDGSNNNGYIKSENFNSNDPTDPYNNRGDTGWGIAANGDAVFNNVYVGGTLDATTGLLMETRTTDPASPQNGRIWLRTDL